jgi:hypothetical protein
MHFFIWGLDEFFLPPPAQSFGVLEALIDGTVFLSSRAGVFPEAAAPDSTLVILAQVKQ